MKSILLGLGLLALAGCESPAPTSFTLPHAHVYACNGASIAVLTPDRGMIMFWWRDPAYAEGAPFPPCYAWNSATYWSIRMHGATNGGYAFESAVPEKELK